MRSILIIIQVVLVMSPSMAQSSMKEKIQAARPQQYPNQASNGYQANNNTLPSTHPANRYRQMSDASFKEALKRLRNIGFDKDRLLTAKFITSSNWLSVQQVLDVTGLFFSDKYKLDYAKYAYEYTFDRGNYFLVNDKLTMRSSRLELMEYITEYDKKNRF